MTRLVAPTCLVLLAAASLSLDRAAAQEDVLRVIAMPPPSPDARPEDNQGAIIDQRLHEHFRHLRDKALEAGATIIVLEVTTPGGLVVVAEQMIDDLRALRERDGVRTVAYVPHHATSAGAMIALACEELVMGPNAEIGNVIPLTFQDGRTLRLAEPKIKTKVVTTMRSLASTCGWPELVLEGMVDENRHIIAVKDRATGNVEILPREEYQRLYGRDLPAGMVRKDIAPEGQAVELTTADVEYLGLPVRTAPSRAALPRVLGLGDRDLEDEEVLQIPRSKGPSLFGDFDFSNVAGLLLLVLGVVCIVMELKTPGLGVFGVLGLMFFMAFFVLTADDTSTVALTTAFLVLGFFLILAEILIIPGFGIAGAGGLALILLSLFVAGVQPDGPGFIDKVIPDEKAEWVRTQGWAIQLLAVLVVGVGAAVFLAKNLQHVPLLNKTLLRPPVLQTSAGPTAAAAPGASTPSGAVAIAPGTVGISETDLRPAGRARFEEDVVDVVSDGEWVRRGTCVRVVASEGNRVVVVPEGGAA